MSYLKDLIFARYNDMYNVLVENEEKAIVCFDGNDVSLLVDKSDGKISILVPLTKNHSFDFGKDWVKVDGEYIHSDMYWREDGCQVIEYQGGTTNRWLSEKIQLINVSFLKKSIT